MSPYTKKEEKLLKRLFSKRRNDLTSAISHIINSSRSETIAEEREKLMEKHQREIKEITELEKKIFYI
jgi:hypothetical protein